MAMTAPYLVHIDDVEPEHMRHEEGWAISEFRLPVTGVHGSTTTVFHALFLPGSTHAKHVHNRCDEIAVYLEGNGAVGQDDERSEVRAGHCRLIPAGRPHFFHNETRDRAGSCIGFYLGATDVADTGYEFQGHVAPEDLAMGRMPTLSEGILVHIDDVEPLALDPDEGWQVSDVRMPIGSHNGGASAQYWMKLLPGDIHHKHRFDRCEVIYFVAAGQGVAGVGGSATPVRAGHVLFLPAGHETFLANTDAADTLEVIGVYAGAGSIESAGYVHTGQVRTADINPAT